MVCASFSHGTEERRLELRKMKSTESACCLSCLEGRPKGRPKGRPMVAVRLEDGMAVVLKTVEKGLEQKSNSVS